MLCGLGVLHYLARMERPATEQEISRECSIPRPTVKKLLRQLRAADIVGSVAGRGHILARPAGQISAYEVMKAVVEEKGKRKDCTMDYGTCAFRTVCPVAPLCHITRDGVEKTLHSFSVADLAYEAPAMP